MWFYFKTYGVVHELRHHFWGGRGLPNDDGWWWQGEGVVKWWHHQVSILKRRMMMLDDVGGGRGQKLPKKWWRNNGRPLLCNLSKSKNYYSWLHVCFSFRVCNTLMFHYFNICVGHHCKAETTNLILLTHKRNKSFK